MLRPIEFAALVDGAAIGRLHDRRAAARADDELPAALLVGLAPGWPAGRACATRHNICDLAFSRSAIARWLSVEAAAISASALRGLGNPGRAVEDEGRGDPRLVEQQLGLQQLELEADRPQILAQQEVHVLEGEAIGVADGLRAFGRLGGGLGLLARRLEDALGGNRIRS